MKYVFFSPPNTHAILLNGRYLTKSNRQTVIILLLHDLRMLLERPTIDLNATKSWQGLVLLSLFFHLKQA